MAKYSQEFKLEVVQHYLSGKAGQKNTASLYAIHHSMVENWSRIYKLYGSEALKAQSSKKTYSAKLKLQVVKAIQQHGLSFRQAAVEFNIVEASTIYSWMRLYERGGVKALQPKVRGCQPKMQKPFKINSQKHDNQKTHQELLDELLYLRTEVAYLKKLDALNREQQIHGKKPESSRN